ncbi:hypothetical protein T07_8088 [Trichinella nelsoni]|uniref:Uncharacterized protein n=1 Tax=Trichinella nelsoni TaxID=6336 RepID=A0A0V0RIR1_9BILA|nr:hypothetical protein T07_8088 [Trichinella nelsoni]
MGHHRYRIQSYGQVVHHFHQLFRRSVRVQGDHAVHWRAGQKQGVVGGGQPNQQNIHRRGCAIGTTKQVDENGVADQTDYGNDNHQHTADDVEQKLTCRI